MKNHLKSITLIVATLFALASCTEDHSHAEMEAEIVDVAAETTAAISVMKSYKDAIQKLTTEGTMELFTKDALVFESGGSEGTYANYESHHLGPELVHFNSFIFSDYNIDVKIDMPFAFATETYIYTIALKANEEKGRPARIIKKKGVATSVLKKIDGKWMITTTHSSSRGVKSSH